MIRCRMWFYYREDKNWLYFVESVTSVGSMDSKRMLEITEMTKNVVTGKIFVRHFLVLRLIRDLALFVKA